MKKSSRRLNPSVNAGSMADIAFLLLIFFLVSTEIMNEKGIPIILPPYTENTTTGVASNVFKIWINSENELMADEIIMDVNNLKDATKNFILNKTRNSSSLLVTINSDENTSFDMYVNVYAELKKAYKEIWENESRQTFNKNLNELSREEFEIIKKKYPFRISEVEKYNI